MALRLALSVEEILALPEDGYRHELVDGIHHVSPAPGLSHQLVVANLLIGLMAACPRGLVVLPGPCAWVIVEPDGKEHEVQPDLLVVTEEQARHVRLQAEVPALVVEVISPGAANRARDEVDKFAVYERAGLPFYWLVDPEVPSVRGYQHDGSALRLVIEATGEDEAVFEQPFPVRFRPTDLIGRIGSPGPSDL